MADLEYTYAAFQAHLAERKLAAARCRVCHQLYLPPRQLCPACFSQAMEWVELSGKGKLIAFSVIHIPPTAMIDAGYDRNNPYCSGVVQLEEGPSICGQILDVDVKNPSTIEIGTPVQVEFIQRGKDDGVKMFLAFRPTDN
jgi:hypothetical protein